MRLSAVSYEPILVGFLASVAVAAALTPLLARAARATGVVSPPRPDRWDTTHIPTERRKSSTDRRLKMRRASFHTLEVYRRQRRPTTDALALP